MVLEDENQMGIMLTPNLHFCGCCEEAIRLYQRAFGAEVLCLYRNDDANPDDYVAGEGRSAFVYHAEIAVGGSRIMLSDLDEGAPPPSGRPMSLALTFGSADAVKRAFAVLGEGADILSPMRATTYASCFVSLVDRFGMRWELMTEQTER